MGIHINKIAFLNMCDRSYDDVGKGEGMINDYQFMSPPHPLLSIGGCFHKIPTTRFLIKKVTEEWSTQVRKQLNKVEGNQHRDVPSPAFSSCRALSFHGNG